LQAAGLRELLEETGHAPQVVNAETVRYLGVIWDNPAFGPAQSHLYAAWGLREVQATRRDPAEFVTLHWQPVGWLREAVRSGEIQDRVVVAAVALLLLNGWME
jgi:8-oxo-dGTP pyrophosphatase MutT (NUDIX family)